MYEKVDQAYEKSQIKLIYLFLLIVSMGLIFWGVANQLKLSQTQILVGGGFLILFLTSVFFYKEQKEEYRYVQESLEHHNQINQGRDHLTPNTSPYTGKYQSIMIEGRDYGRKAEEAYHRWNY